MIDHYDWPGGREAMIRFGPATGPVVVAALPLFEEANRTRAFTVTILRALAARGIASVLPDLPGQGESLVPTRSTTIMAMREAIAAVIDSAHRPVYFLGIRSGAMLDSLALVNGSYRLSPQDGPELLRELTRVHQASAGPLADNWWQADEAIEVGGNCIAAELFAELTVLTVADSEGAWPTRTVRLDTDVRPADLKLPGAPQWRRAEPDNDPALAALLADDIAAWVRQCEG